MDTLKNKIKKLDEGSIVTPAGFKATGLHAGMKRKRNDLGLIYCKKPANTAAVYTLNQIQAAPLQVTKESIAKEGKIQALIVNSGNANACTGEQGDRKSTRLNSSHVATSYAVFCLKKKKRTSKRE